MEEILVGVDWTAVIAGFIAAFALGWLWYSPTLFGTKWMQGTPGVGAEQKGGRAQTMIAQAFATFLLAWVIGVTAVTDSLLLAVLIIITAAALIKTNGLWSGKSKYAIVVDAGYILAMGAVMIAAHAVF